MVHNQHIGRNNDVALKINSISGAYRATCGDPAAVLDCDFNFVFVLRVSLIPGVKPGVPTYLNSIA
jgi:hypothetical protein